MKKASKRAAEKKTEKSTSKRAKPAATARAKNAGKAKKSISSTRVQEKAAKPVAESAHSLKKNSAGAGSASVTAKRFNDPKKNSRPLELEAKRARKGTNELPDESAVSPNLKSHRNGQARERNESIAVNDKSPGRKKKQAVEAAGRSRPEPVPPPVKTFLNEKQLAEFKELLLLKRAQLTGDVQGLATEARGRSAQGESEHSNMPIHMADLGSDTWEQDFTLGLIVNAESVVREIDEALERIKDRTYGICTVGDDRIGIARLRAKPWAKHCIEHARLIEEGRLH